MCLLEVVLHFGQRTRTFLKNTNKSKIAHPMIPLPAPVGFKQSSLCLFSQGYFTVWGMKPQQSPSENQSTILRYPMLPQPGPPGLAVCLVVFVHFCVFFLQLGAGKRHNFLEKTIAYTPNAPHHPPSFLPQVGFPSSRLRFAPLGVQSCIISRRAKSADSLAHDVGHLYVYRGLVIIAVGGSGARQNMAAKSFF